MLQKIVLAALIAAAPCVSAATDDITDFVELRVSLPKRNRFFVDARVRECLAALRNITDPNLRDIMLWVIDQYEGVGLA
jgi:hypothetical protein